MSSVELDEVLSAQKSSSDKTDLGYTVSSGLSSSMAFGSRTVFVPQSEKGDKGMKFKTDLINFKSFIGPHVCHHVVFLDIFILIVLSCISVQMVTGFLSRIYTFVWKVIKSFGFFNSILGEF